MFPIVRLPSRLIFPHRKSRNPTPARMNICSICRIRIIYIVSSPQQVGREPSPSLFIIRPDGLYCMGSLLPCQIKIPSFLPIKDGLYGGYWEKRSGFFQLSRIIYDFLQIYSDEVTFSASYLRFFQVSRYLSAGRCSGRELDLAEFYLHIRRYDRMIEGNWEVTVPYRMISYQ